MNLRGPICRLIVDELPVDTYGMKVLAAARELWTAQGKVCITTGRALGREFPVVQIIGGEPMNYPQRIIEVVEQVRASNPTVRVKLFTGFPDVEGLLKVAPLVDAIAVTLASADDEHHFRAARLGFRDFGPYTDGGALQFRHRRRPYGPCIYPVLAVGGYGQRGRLPTGV